MMNEAENDKLVDIHSCLLDPLSVIIKLSILSCKPDGTKLHITNNIIYYQESGFFQPVCRYVFNANRIDLHYLYNPIEIACKTYLTDEFMKLHPKIKELFERALLGLKKLSITYNKSSTICLCLTYYEVLITNHLNKDARNLFKNDKLSQLYTNSLIDNLKKMWTPDKIKIILNLTTFIANDAKVNNVESIERIMLEIDNETQKIIKTNVSF